VAVTNAGHLPALLVTAGHAGYVDVTSPLLGLPNGAPRRTHTWEPGEDWAVVLVTDGLVERRSGNVRQALDTMADVVADAGTLHPEQLCDLLLHRFDISDREDDVAVLVVGSAVP
jgi:serine phosphatase RsbU (regulator of sigma subunit)